LGHKTKKEWVKELCLKHRINLVALQETKMENVDCVTIKALWGLVDIPLRGYAFTWAHKSATKMSKLDRFLISKGLMEIFPHLSALCLDRHLVLSLFVKTSEVAQKAKIKRAVLDCGTNKSLCPDGFSFDFICKFWNIIDEDVVAALKDFFATAKFPRGCNSSFIALIQKIQDAKVVKDFCPISLIGTLGLKINDYANMDTIKLRWGSKISLGECLNAKSRITCDNTNGNTMLSKAQGVSLLITSGVRVSREIGWNKA
ncbi:hypothetical protein Tco_1300029, partial [Tanacetum coccineum]